MWPSLLLLFAFCCLQASCQQFSYTRNCIDQHHKEVKCTVEIVDCDNDAQLPARVNDSSQVPGEAHDIRVEPFAKAISRRQAEAYQLSVDISFQTPPNNSTRLLKGFFVEIESDDQKTRLCFLFNVSESNWTPQAISSSPRLHFSTESLFRFDQKYDVTVSSLPESSKLTRSAHKNVLMPHNPRSTNFSNILSPNCSKYSHPTASKWTAGFRKISLKSLERTIEVQFVGAPPQYCFEQYEVRLLDESGLELLHSDLISVEQMSSEEINNQTIYFGTYNFTGLELNKTYIPSVIAVERAADGRCLCPVYGTDPYDNTVVCSCIAADSAPIILPLVKMDEPERAENKTSPADAEQKKTKESTGWAVYIIMTFVVVFTIGCIVFMLVNAYRHYALRGKMVRIRFIHDRSSEDLSSLPSGNQSKSLLEPVHSGGIVLKGSDLNVLIVYAHDTPEHDAAVLALADFLQRVFHFDVHLDVYDADLIEKNLMDYLSSSIVNADKVLVVNSMGAKQRHQAKVLSVTGGGYLIENNDPTAFDSLFTAQIDMFLQHHSIVSVRFDFSHFDEVIHPLQGSLQYVLPANMTPLLCALTGTNLKGDPRLSGYSPAAERLTAAIKAQRARIEANPSGWFAATHHRRPRIAVQPSMVPMQTALPLPVPSMSTLPTASMADDDYAADVGEIESGTHVRVESVNEMEEADDCCCLLQRKEETAKEKEQSMPEHVPVVKDTRIPQLEEATVLNVPIEEPALTVPRRSVDFEPADSGVYDDTTMLTSNSMEQEEEEDGQQYAHQSPADLALTRLPPAAPTKAKWQRGEDDQMDSGLISDVDLHMISAS